MTLIATEYRALLKNPVRQVEIPMMGRRQYDIATDLINAQDFVRFPSLGDQDSLRNMNAKGLVTRHHKDARTYKITEKGVKSYIRTCTNRK